MEHVTYDVAGTAFLSYLKEWSCPCGHTTAAYVEYSNGQKPHVEVNVKRQAFPGYYAWETIWKNGKEAA